jgi:eukaryotic-like serine/threonine-protein kinase
VGTLAPVLLLTAVLLARGGPPPAPPVQSGVPAGLGQEVAPPWSAPEGGEGAVPPWALTPAPVALATPSKDIRVKTPQQTPSTQEQKPKRKALGRTLKAAGVATCTALAGCPAAQVLPNPPGEPCPPGAVEAMKKAGLPEPYDTHTILSGSFLGTGDVTERILVRPGQSATLVIHTYGSPLDELYGRLLFGEGRVYGRFTQAKLESGESIPVCYEFYDSNARKPGIVMEGQSGPDTARIFGGGRVRAVTRFE